MEKQIYFKNKVLRKYIKAICNEIARERIRRGDMLMCLLETKALYNLDRGNCRKVMSIGKQSPSCFKGCPYTHGPC